MLLIKAQATPVEITLEEDTPLEKTSFYVADKTYTVRRDGQTLTLDPGDMVLVSDDIVMEFMKTSNG